jgi:catechol 2,3-dioxygenase-like lactoylglutathione lyase family enzyme
MPNVSGLLETSLYVKNVQDSVRFYQAIFGFPLLLNEERIGAFRVKEGQVLLLFKIGGSVNPMPSSEGTIPPHDGIGMTHIAFAIAAADLDGWRARLEEHNLPIESTINWDSGSKSIYFRDPDQNLLELATPGIWGMRW